MSPTDSYQPSDSVQALAGKLFDLAREGKTDMLVAYLQAGAPPDLTNHKGDSLVMLAAYHGHVETVRKLLEHGADPNRVNDRGQSPLAGAVFKGSDDVVRALLDGGADPDLGTPSARDTARMFGRSGYFDAAN
ncbi:MAG: ankyrin repeat domain-containing protein [Pigmentiphaga sp.]|uniref:ankyrin repeat domain-containing protein n=1 Tax=Pigmentiphaga sp. TaxID=1977564 RepID=UPI0029ADA8CD|nr:ankyrin repeat domain-containing protein [Pigmentiphaga sp.]MDX3907904.1 ankyrin repeat domain-containing protein [Pigmentiphaga sp.]